MDAVRSLEISSAMGVDRAGNLWSWNQTQSSVSRIASDGSHVEAPITTDARALDADPDLGIIVLSQSGRVARVFDWSGKQIANVALPEEAGKVCWLDDGEFAVTPPRAAYPVPLFSVRTGLMTGHVGAVPAINPPRAGAVLARATHVRYDFARHELVTFDAYQGELNVFSEKGDVVRHATVAHPDHAATEAWLAQMNANARANGESSSPTVWSYPTMTLTAEGNVLLAENLSSDAHKVKIVNIDRKGVVTRSVVTNDCASVRLQEWNRNLLFFRDARATRRCVGIRRR